MTATRIAVIAGEPRAHVELAVGALAPRLISRNATRAHVAVTAAGMVLLGGDHVDIRIDVGPACTLEIEDVGGTVAYPGALSSWNLDVRIGAGGTLLWHGLPFVVTGGADVERRSSLTLGSDARAVIRETLVLGRHGERGGRLSSELSVVDGDGPILFERLEADGRAPEPGVLGGNRTLDAVIAVGFRPRARPHDLEFDLPGAMARHLSDHTHGSPLDPVWDAWAALAEERGLGAAPASLETERNRVEVTA
ncbi:urease accessory protein UreD [Microbacterium allomyrinae]|uniref:urease accessory protein UreD n=1 Tax=Microbacterium allomyrinae TaxID=2830666 RepID=UPI001E5221A2|nr:urease accessory protein UreD [Microbacterium allomyrinae]